MATRIRQRVVVWNAGSQTARAQTSAGGPPRGEPYLIGAILSEANLYATGLSGAGLLTKFLRPSVAYGRKFRIRAN